MIILLAAASRLLPHPPNVAPVGGMALFGAAYYGQRYWAFLAPVAAMWISDLVLNNAIYGQYFDHFVWFHGGMLFTYGAFALIVLLGTRLLSRVSLPRLVFAVPCASVIFFLVSNLGVWLTSGLYPPTASGLQLCLVAGVPFFWNTLAGDALYSSVMFGLFEWSARRFPALRPTLSLARKQQPYITKR
ncbi:MAG: hypothetical protein LBD64_05235 [Odoribacteraceae bacterium]|nr:hypothetical protein [Odoribacteraceae bacterium]